MPLATLSIDLVAKLANLERDMGRAAQIAERNAKRMDAAFAGVNTTLRSVASFAAGAFSVSLFSGLIKSAIDAQDNLKDLSKSTSLSVETLAGLGSAATKSGSDLESVAASINKLSVNMGKDAEKFAAIGISAKDPIEAFKQLADVFNAIQDPQERAAFAAEALGKSWQGAAPLLAEGSKSIGEMVAKGTELSKVTAESAAKADELNDKLADLQTTTGAWTTDLANRLVPSLLDTAKSMEEATSKGQPLLALLRGFAGLGKLPFDLAFDDVDISANGFITDLETKLKDLQSKREVYNPFVPWGDSLEEIDRQILITKNQLEAATKFKDRLAGPISSDAPLSGSRVSPDVSGFIGSGGSSGKGGKGGSSKGSAERVAELTASTRDYQAAMESLRSSLMSAETATQGLDAAQEALHKLMTGAEWDAYPEAMKWAAIEQTSFTSGALAAANAQQRLNELMADTPTAQLEKAQEDAKLLEEALTKAGNAADYKKIKEALDGVYQSTAKGTEQLEEQSSVAKDLGLTFSSAFEDAIVKGEEFSEVLQGIGEDILRIIVRKNITEPLANSFGSIDFGSLLNFNADGGVYSSPSLSAYSGGVYSSPQLFKFANGAGVFGEAGPEAIMPLKRGPDGKLGVSGAGSNVVVNLVEAPGSGKGGSTSTTTGSNGEQIIIVLVEKIKGDLIKDVGSGGSFASAMEGQYSLNRSAGAWR